MVAAVLPSGLPLVPAGALGLVAYAAGFLLFERLAFPEDLTMLRTVGARLLRRRAVPSVPSGI
jgi:hypothetical protein